MKKFFRAGLFFIAGLSLISVNLWAEEESLGTQAGKKAAELQEKTTASVDALNSQAKKTAEELQKTSEEAVKTAGVEWGKVAQDFQTAWNDFVTNLNKQIEDFKTQLQKNQKQTP